MTKEERFEKAATLLPFLEEHKKNGTIDFKDSANLNTLKVLYQSLHGHVDMQMTCASCVFFYLSIISAWYHREYPKYLKTLPIEPVEPELTDELPEPIKEAKPKRNKRR